MRYCPYAMLALACYSAFAAPAGRDGFESIVKPFVKQNCAGCHNEKLASGNLNLQRFLTQPGSIALQDREHWEKAVARLRAGTMPPKGVPRPPEDQIADVTGWIEREYERQDKNLKPDPGRVTARRLNRYEYNNTVRDLLAVNLRVADDFPVDPYGYGFDNIGDVLSVSPVLTEKYLKAAERIAKAAIPTGQPEKLLGVRYISQAMGQGFHLHVQTIHDFPVDGEYMLHTAWEQGFQAGTRMRGRLYLDGALVADVPISVYTEMDRGFDSPKLFVTQGPHKIETEMVVAPELKGPKPYPEFIQIRGPFTQTPPEKTASYRRIFVCGHAPGQHRPECARKILAPLMHRAYRRPVSNEELEGTLRIVELVRSSAAIPSRLESGWRSRRC